MEKLHIKLEPGQKLWFTSDPHFGHRNVIKFCDRPFANEKEMNEVLINNWNEVVGENDIIFVLGDVFWFNDSRMIKKNLQKLNGIIYLISGNHDDFKSYHRVVDDPHIRLCHDIVGVFLEGFPGKKIYEIWLAHLPLSTWPHRERGAIHLFGHIHSQPGKTEGFDQDLHLHPTQCDVGADYWGYKPVQFEKILEKMNIKKNENENS